MALNQWRKFAFFDKKLLKNEAGETLDVLKSFKIWSTTFGRGKMIFGDSEGWIIVMDHKQNVTSFRGYLLQVSHLFMTKQQNILVSVGEDSVEQGTMLKVWNFDKPDGAGNPSCSRMIRINFRSAQELVSCFVVHENLNYLAIGYSSGAVILLKGDITKERNTSKHVVLHEGKSTVTGLAFRPTTTAKGGIILYISSLDEIWSYMIGSRDKETGSILDHHGCGLLCSTMTDSSTDYQFIIGRTDALYFYLPDSRGQCLAFGGTKLLLEWCHGYLVVVSRKEESDSRMSGSDSATGEMQIITIYDVKNKLIAYYGPIQEVRAILCEWGSIFILCTDNRIYQIKEKELLQKLDMLFKKNLYSLAITLAKAQQYDQDALIDMFRQYGDHLYSKGDFDEAMAQYIKTIGRLEPSYVIRQFLDAQRIYNLTAYLSALHESNLASQDHTTLLLNCYTKLKDEEQLDKFVMSKNSNHPVNFDVETAIRVLRQAGYFRHALHLSKTHQKHDWYLKIQLENNKDFVEALDYISRLEYASCEANMKCYGRLLISHASEQCTELLKRLCTAYTPKSDGRDAPDVAGGSSPSAANPEDFFHIFVNHSGLMCEFLEYVANCRSDLSPEFYNTLLELYLEKWKNSNEESVKDSLQQKAVRLLQRENCCDPMQALLLCQMNDFAPGILYMYEQKRMYTEILQFYMDRKGYEQVVQTCRRFGEKETHLWVQAFWFFGECFGEYDKFWIAEVLKVIETKNLLPSLMVIDILSRNPNTTLDIIRDYVIIRMKSDERKIQEDEAQIQKFREKSEQIRKEVDHIKNGAQIFQDANCSACDKSLELPSVHFLCRHSYHQHCFESYSDTEECPICRPENRKLLDEIYAQDQNKDLSQQFFSRVNKEADSFSVVAEYFGKRLFGRQTPIDDLLFPGNKIQNFDS